MSGRRAFGLLLALLICMPAWAGQLSVHAFLVPGHVSLGDTVTLNIRVDGSSQASRPDTRPLHADFQILDSSRSGSVSVVNGRASASTLWAYTLRPRHRGRLTVPALRVGSLRTKPLSLVVAAAAPAGSAAAVHGPAFVDMSASTLSPWVGQQVDLTVRLYYRGDLTDGSLSTPSGDGLDIRQVGQGLQYQQQRNGRDYNVVERHYAVIPQRAGALQVKGVQFQGRTLDTGGLPGGFMNFGRPISASAAPLTLHVQAQPAAAGGGPWVPAREVALSLDGLPSSGRIQVGEPLTLTLRERATGLPFESLPALSLPDLKGVQVYPDKSQDATGHDGHWLVGRRQRKFALVAAHAGTLTLPAITLRWWDVVHQREQTARIPAHTLQVVAAAAGGGQGGATPAPATAASRAAAAAATATAGPNATVPATASAAWRTVALASLALWLLSALAALLWMWRRRRRHRPSDAATDAEQPGVRRARHAFLAGLRSGRADLAAPALLRWARAERPVITQLGALAAALDDPAQRDAIATLQRCRFAAAGTAEGYDADALVRAFRGGLRWRSAPQGEAAPVLPPLYPPA